MSLRSGSLKLPLFAGLIFCIGIGLGAGWKLGWIPLDYAAPAAGTLDDADQTAADETGSVTEDGPLAESDGSEEPAWVADHSEPPVEEGVNQKIAVVQTPAEDHLPFVRAAKPQSRRPVLRDDIPPLRVRPANYQTEDDDAPQQRESPRAFTEPAEKTPVADRFAEIDEKLAAGEILAAHKLLSKLYWNASGPDDDLQARLDDTAKKIFFSPQPHFIEPYVIQTGDQLRKVAGKYHLSWEYLAKLNKTDPRKIREGQKLKVLKGPFAAIVSLHDFSLTVHLQGYYVKRYTVGIGKDGSSPIGKFPVLGKMENPQYTDPDGKVLEGDDPKNPLGERWIDLGDSYGLHGTIEPDSIGKAASRGCIRLRDADIIEVYDFLVSGSVVEIRE